MHHLAASTSVPLRVEPSVALPSEFRDRLDERIARGELELPTLPQAAALMLSMTNEDDFDPRKLENAVQADAAMAAHLLRVANSPIFTARVPMVSLRQAICRLGAYELRHIALIFACETRVFRVPGWERDVRELLSHSLRVALYSQRIAKLAKLNAEEAFLSGLLHDIGYPVMLQAMSDLQRQIPCSIPRAAFKQAAFDRHAAAGASLASAWAFSPRLISVVKTHHAPSHDEGGSKHAALVHLADELARPPSVDDPESSAPLRDPWSIEALKLSPADLEALAAQGEEVEKAMRAFG